MYIFVAQNNKFYTYCMRGQARNFTPIFTRITNKGDTDVTA